MSRRHPFNSCWARGAGGDIKKVYDLDSRVTSGKVRYATKYGLGGVSGNRLVEILKQTQTRMRSRPASFKWRPPLRDEHEPRVRRALVVTTKMMSCLILDRRGDTRRRRFVGGSGLDGKAASLAGDECCC